MFPTKQPSGHFSCVFPELCWELHYPGTHPCPSLPPTLSPSLSAALGTPQPWGQHSGFSSLGSELGWHHLHPSIAWVISAPAENGQAGRDAAAGLKCFSPAGLQLGNISFRDRFFTRNLLNGGCQLGNSMFGWLEAPVGRGTSFTVIVEHLTRAQSTQICIV